MTLFDDIRQLEERLQDELIAAGSYSSVDDFVRAYTAAVIDGLPADPAAADIDSIVRTALENSRDIINAGLGAQIDASTRKIVADTVAFYEGLGVALPDLAEAVERSREIKDLTEVFQAGMAQMREELLEGTIEVMQRQIASAGVDRGLLEEAILEFADGKAFFARVNAKMVVSAYNRIGRDQVRQSAGLQHGLYFGDIRTNTRPFCRRLVGKVFAVEQIEAMNNGQLAPVKVYAGGWNCIHSWLWVDPDWDEELKNRLSVDEAVRPVKEDGLDLIVP